jgi:hypothetical protein
VLWPPAPSHADPNFGTKFVSGLGTSRPGASTSIWVDATQTAAAGEILLQRAVVQSDFGATAGLAQAGTGMTSANTGLSNCGVRASPTAYTEFKFWGTANNVASYFCYWFNSVTPNVQYDYQVCHYGPAYPQSWYTVLNGSMMQQSWLGFNGGSPAAGGEINGHGPGVIANGSVARATYRWTHWFAGDYCTAHTLFGTQYAYNDYLPSVSWAVTNPVGGEFFVVH